TAAATEQKPLTDAGTILGTFQYMAPEQVEGQPADARTDIFALGAVLYEAATGNRAFEGKSRASLIAAILDHDPPPIPAVRPLAPVSLDRVVRACLQKDPSERIHTAHDLMLDLTWIRESSSSGESVAVARSRRRRWIAPALIALLAAATLALAMLYLRARSPELKPWTFSILSAPGSSNGDAVAVSPDGTSVAYYGSRTAGGVPLLWIRRFSDPTPRPIAGTEGAEFPFWSPDSQWVAFFGHNQKLTRVNVATGTLQDLCDADYGVGGAWSSDGTIIFSRRFSDGLYRVPASGGEPVALTRLNPARRESVHGWPHFLSDRQFAFVIRTTGEERNQIAVASLDDPKPKVLMKADSLVGFDRGNLLYVRENTLFAQRLDERTLELKGEPVEIATNVAFSESWGTSGASVSPAGVIAYYPVYLPRVEVRVYDRKGAALRTVLTDDFIGEPQFSPDGRRIAFSRFDQKKGASDIWIVDVARGIRSRVTGGLADHVSPAWSPDRERIAWLSDRDGMYDVLTQQVDSNARPVNIWRGGRDKVSVQWMPDGRSILATVEFPNTLRDIYIGSTTGEKPKPVVTDQSDDEDASASPDGHWIAFASRHAGGPYEVYVIPA
ncbi:MAG: protein kinase domain-containing protein, partial [Thermoanaerobaculia bacterium]